MAYMWQDPQNLELLLPSRRANSHCRWWIRVPSNSACMVRDDYVSGRLMSPDSSWAKWFFCGDSLLYPMLFCDSWTRLKMCFLFDDNGEIGLVLQHTSPRRYIHIPYMRSRWMTHRAPSSLRRILHMKHIASKQEFGGSTRPPLRGTTDSRRAVYAEWSPFQVGRNSRGSHV